MVFRVVSEFFLSSEDSETSFRIAMRLIFCIHREPIGQIPAIKTGYDALFFSLPDAPRLVHDNGTCDDRRITSLLPGEVHLLLLRSYETLSFAREKIGIGDVKTQGLCEVAGIV